MPDHRQSALWMWRGGGSDGAFTWGVVERLLSEWREKPEAILCSSAGLYNALAYCVGAYRAIKAGAVDPSEQSEIILASMRHAWMYVLKHGAPFAELKKFIPDSGIEFAAIAATEAHMLAADATANYENALDRWRKFAPLTAVLMPDYRHFVRTEARHHPLFQLVEAAIAPEAELRAALAHPDVPRIITGCWDTVGARHIVMDTKELSARGELNFSQLLASMALVGVVPAVHGRFVDDAYSGVARHLEALTMLQDKHPEFKSLPVTDVHLGQAGMIELNAGRLNPNFTAMRQHSEAHLAVVKATHPFRTITRPGVEDGAKTSAKDKLFPDTARITTLHAQGADSRIAWPDYEPATGAAADVDLAPRAPRLVGSPWRIGQPAGGFAGSATHQPPARQFN